MKFRLGNAFAAPAMSSTGGVFPVCERLVVGRHEALVDADILDAELFRLLPARESDLFVVHDPGVLRGSFQQITHRGIVKFITPRRRCPEVRLGFLPFSSHKSPSSSQ